MALGLRQQLEPVLFATRGFSTWRDPFSLEKLRRRFSDYLAGLDLGRKRDLLLSSEELSGHMAGRTGLPSYAAVPEIAEVLEQCIIERFGPQTELCFFFSLRDAGPWLQSAWAEHVKSSRMELDFETFSAANPMAADFAPVIEATRAAVQSPVKTARLEELAEAEFGPATPLLDLIGLPEARRAKLKPPRHMNQRRDPEVLEALLELNRSDLDKEALKQAKEALLGR
ncbi:hypothetical protein FHY55_17780 [Oceanicola sp. D3]|uniref:hypothetical protein n=1 Tax=Oceanicola sp. D3 TaxID=2587163 RepID=UPI001122C0A3|nr:hypothetical protein [Oceanicola sp. D3]QDC10968.1 hypothetical protein FHY55_17780 [Oceanicola sp. D3]